MIVPECKSARQSSIQGSQYSCFNLSSAVNARVRSRCFQCKCLHNFCFFHFLALPSNFEFVLANLLKINASQDKPVCQSGGETAFKPCTSAVIVSWKIMIRWCRVKRMDKGKERDGKKTCKNVCDPTVHAYTYSFFVVFCSLKAFCTSEGFWPSVWKNLSNAFIIITPFFS